MIEMNPYYARESNVGPVFDLTTWSGRRLLMMAITGIAFGALSLAVMVYMWDPSLFIKKPPQGMEELVDGVRRAWKSYPWPMRGGMAFLGLFGTICLMFGCATFSDVFRRDYYFRAGRDGLSIRMPYGLAWNYGGFVSKPLELDLRWDAIQSINITQSKQLGSMSRNSGNIHAKMKLRTRDGKSYLVSLEGLEAPAYAIHQRLNEAREMVPAKLDDPNDGETLPSGQESYCLEHSR